MIQREASYFSSVNGRPYTIGAGADIYVRSRQFPLSLRHGYSLELPEQLPGRTTTQDGATN